MKIINNIKGEKNMTLDAWENKKAMRTEEEKAYIKEIKNEINTLLERLKKQTGGIEADVLIAKLEELLTRINDGDIFNSDKFEVLKKVLEAIQVFDPQHPKNLTMSLEEIINKFGQCEHENSENCDGCSEHGAGCGHIEIEQY